MNVSIFADASLCPKTRVAAWGAYCRSDRGISYEGAALKSSYKVTGDAELHAIVNAVHLAFRSGVAQPGDILLVQSDCAEAIRMIEGEQPARRRGSKAGVDKLHALVKSKNAKLSMRHVKGHSGRGTGRFAANTHCHQLAIEAMREKRDSILGKNAVWTT